jgi:hypothetical protein
LETHKQGSPEWLLGRNGRITGTVVAGLLGLSPYKSAKKTYKSIISTVPQRYGFETLRNFTRGHAGEEAMSELYARNELNPGESLVQPGLMVPKWNLGYGVSLDRIVANRLGKWIRVVEIKTSTKGISQNLLDEFERIESGLPPRRAKDVIYPSHFWQMQLQMKVSNILNTDYCVYSPSDNEYLKYSLEFDYESWENAEPTLQKYLEQLAEEPNLQRRDPTPETIIQPAIIQ